MAHHTRRDPTREREKIIITMLKSGPKPIEQIVTRLKVNGFGKEEGRKIVYKLVANGKIKRIRPGVYEL